MTIASRAVRAVAGRDAAAAYSRWESRRDQYWHRSSATLGSVALAQALDWPVWRYVVVALAGWTFGGGRWSPDADQGRAWRLLRALVPDILERALGNPLAHHKITHSVPIHATLVAAGATWAPGMWPVWWVAVAWLLHDLGDWLIGRAYQGEAGPSWAPWGCQWGLGWWKSGGFVGGVLTLACWPALVWLLWTAPLA